MAKFLHNGPCDKCGSKDNKATYDNGSTWCWGCRKYTPPNAMSFIPNLQEEEEEEIYVPHDLSRDFPTEVVEFIGKYEITIEELIKNDYFWSKNQGSLFRSHSKLDTNKSPIWTDQRRIQTVLLGHCRKPIVLPKSIFRGRKEDAFAFTTPKEGVAYKPETLCLTEDSLSAIKVGRVVNAMPLFGTYISATKINKLVNEYKFQQVIVWLDHDKFKEAWEIADKFKWLGCGAKVVLTKLDPKCYNELEIMEYIK